MAIGARVRRGICDAPVEQVAHRIVGTRQRPGGRDTFVDWSAIPRITRGILVVLGGVKTPDFLAADGVVRGDVAIGTQSPDASARRDDFAIDDDGAGSVAA